MISKVRVLTLFIGFIGVSLSSYAQLAEIAPFDTAQSPHANAGRIFSDAVKENILGNSKEAEALFLRFAEAEPREAATYYELARLNAKNNEKEKGLQNIRRAIDLDTSNKWYRELYGNLLADSRKFSEAAEVFSKLGRSYTPNEDYLLKASLFYERSGQYKKAIDELELLLAQRGYDDDVLMQINQIYLKENKVEQSAQTIRRMIEANPHEARYYTLLAEMYLNNKHDEQSLQTLKESEKLFPGDIAVELGFAAYYKRKNNTAKYLEYADKAIVNKDLDEETQAKLLVSYLQDVEGDSSLRQHSTEIVRKVLDLHPNNALLNGVMGDLLSMQGRNREALESYKRSLRQDSTNLNTWQQVMFGMTGKEDADSLISYSNAALTLFPASAVVYYLNGIGYSNKGAYDKAAKSISTAIDFQPEENKVLLAEMYASLADAYNSSKSYAEADKNFDKALELAPENATVLNNYAYYLSVRKSRLEDAERFSAKSLQIRPDEPTFLDTYGWIFYQQGKYQRSAELIQKAIDKEGAGADATLYEHLGDAYFKLNQTDKALQNWQKALEKDPTNTTLQQKIKNRKTDD